MGSTRWTVPSPPPGHRVHRVGLIGPGAPGRPGGGASRSPSEAEPPDEAELDEVRKQLLDAPVEVVVANHAYGLFELAALHLSAQPPNLEKARLAVDALGALVEGLSGRLGNVETATDGGPGADQARLRPDQRFQRLRRQTIGLISEPDFPPNAGSSGSSCCCCFSSADSSSPSSSSVPAPDDASPPTDQPALSALRVTTVTPTASSKPRWPGTVANVTRAPCGIRRWRSAIDVQWKKS